MSNNKQLEPPYRGLLKRLNIGIRLDSMDRPCFWDELHDHIEPEREKLREVVDIRLAASGEYLSLAVS